MYIFIYLCYIYIRALGNIIIIIIVNIYSNDVYIMSLNKQMQKKYSKYTQYSVFV